jgi:hypothetical protein
MFAYYEGMAGNADFKHLCTQPARRKSSHNYICIGKYSVFGGKISNYDTFGFFSVSE